MSSDAIQRALPAAPVSAAVTTSQIFAALAALGSIGATPAPAVPAFLAVSGSNRLEQKAFKAVATGIATTAGAYTVTVTLFGAAALPGTPFTPGSWSVLGVSGATAVGTTTAAWKIEADLLFDSVSGKLQGTVSSDVNNTLVAAAAVTNPLTGLVGSGEPVFYLAVGVTFSTASTSNVAKMADFALNA